MAAENVKFLLQLLGIRNKSAFDGVIVDDEIDEIGMLVMDGQQHSRHRQCTTTVDHRSVSVSWLRWCMVQWLRHSNTGFVVN